MSEQKATNVHWHGGEINRPERAQLLGHGGATLWFTGLSGSGKSTIAVALEQALYQRGVQKMIAELPQAPQAADWRDMMLLYIDGVRDFYMNNRVEMILALLPVSLVSVNQVSREFGQALFQLLHSQGLVPKSQQVVRACEMASELADLVWRKSLIERGTLTPAYTREVKRVVLSYLEAVLSD